MKWILGLAVFAGVSQHLTAAILPAEVAILYNSRVPESKALAETYRKARDIPVGNLISLDMPSAQDISREDFERSILRPLRRQFEARSWWQRESQGGGITLPVSNKIRILVTIRGVPLRILSDPNAAKQTASPQNPIAGHDEASVDSELAMFGVEDLPSDGILQNKYYKSDKSISQANLPFLTLTARIDAPTYATCERMIQDAIDCEKSGLWGRAYVDVANKFPQGDEWLEQVVKSNNRVGIPTVVDRFNETFPTNYPMTEAALYLGWYDANLSGPFLNPSFRFRKGAVAMHLHSFSAEQLRDPARNWSGGLLEKGAAVTLGNVFEPYLHLSHDFGLLHERLLAGFTWAEACWMAIPVTSWQGVILGDPLYTPFKHLDGGGVKDVADVEYRALHAASVEWGKAPVEKQRQLEKASERMKSATLAEAIGLDLAERKEFPAAANWFNVAETYFIPKEDKLRQAIHQIALDRVQGKSQEAISKLRTARMHHGSTSGAESLKAWLDQLAPPPPAAEVPR